MVFLFFLPLSYLSGRQGSFEDNHNVRPVNEYLIACVTCNIFPYFYSAMCADVIAFVGKRRYDYYVISKKHYVFTEMCQY